VRLLVCVLISVALMVVDHRFSLVKDVRSALSVVVYPIQYAVNFPLTAGGWMSESFTTRETLQQELDSLKSTHLLNAARLQKLAALETENQRLRQLLDSSFKIGERVLIAELLAVDLEPFTNQVVINKGSNHGVYDGQPLLDAHGVMGQVTQVGPLTSTVMLITDPNHAIPVAVNRNGLRAIALGTGNPDKLEIPHFPNDANIEVGDLLISTGLGGRFPGGYPVATISQIQQNPGQPFALVIATPTAKLRQSREVLLVWPQTTDEPTQPSATTTPATADQEAPQ
jgi:rod shape-determining protein MreC